MPTLATATVAQVEAAGELLIRAIAMLGALPFEQQEALRQTTDGSLPDLLALALRSAREVSPGLATSLRRHPPRGLGSLVL